MIECSYYTKTPQSNHLKCGDDCIVIYFDMTSVPLDKTSGCLPKTCLIHWGRYVCLASIWPVLWEVENTCLLDVCHPRCIANNVTIYLTGVTLMENRESEMQQMSNWDDISFRQASHSIESITWYIHNTNWTTCSEFAIKCHPDLVYSPFHR